MKTFRVGTRTSPLAMKQTQIVIDALKQQDPDITIEIVGILTKGDRMQNASLAAIGGKGVFVKEVEYQLLQGMIDFAVHSLKDMPANLPEGLVLAATPPRANPYDCVIFQECNGTLATSQVIGTSSIRREKQLAEAYPHLSFVPIRGKIETRIQKMHDQQMSGTVLACAGLERMAYFDQLPAYQILQPAECVPAVGQGILAVECRQADTELIQRLARITDSATVQAAEAERSFLRKLNGNCDIPLGAFAQPRKEGWAFFAYLAAERTSQGKSVCLEGKDPQELAEQAYQILC